MKRVVAMLFCVALLGMMVGTLSHGKPIVSSYGTGQTS